MTHTPLVKAEDEDSDIACCGNGQELTGEHPCLTCRPNMYVLMSVTSLLPGNLRHPECFPTPIPATDSFFGRLGQRCMEFTRSMPARNAECNLGAREQVRKKKD